jgi:hypothetical protein
VATSVTVFARSRLSPAERDELLDVFSASCRWTRIYDGWRPNLRDLRTAELKFPGLVAVTPAQLLKHEVTP